MVSGISGGTEIAETCIEVLYKAHRSDRDEELWGKSTEIAASEG